MISDIEKSGIGLKELRKTDRKTITKVNKIIDKILKDKFMPYHGVNGKIEKEKSPRLRSKVSGCAETERLKTTKLNHITMGFNKNGKRKRRRRSKDDIDSGIIK